MSHKERKLSSTKKRQQKIKEQTNDSTPPPSLSSHESSSSSPEFANIAIKIYNFENLQYLLDEQSHEEFEIVAKFMNTKINSDTAAADESRRLSANNKNSFEITFNIRVDVSSEEEILNVCASPILLSLLKYEGSEATAVLGHCSVDMMVLCTPHVESKTFYKLSFEREFSGHAFRRISFDCVLSSDVPLLKAPYGNMLFLTFDSIHNVDIMDEITIGFQAPMGCEFSKNFTFTKAIKSGITEHKNHKRWHSHCDIIGNASRSSYENQPYNFPLKCDDKNLLLQSENSAEINTMMRIMLSSESTNFLHNHIRCEKKIAVEVMHNNAQMIGFINAEELLHVGRKRIRLAVPLVELDNETMMRDCGYEGGTCLKSRVKSEIKREIASANKSFIVVEMELEKPLNEEVFENLQEIPKSAVESVNHAEEKVSCLRKNLQAIVRNLLASELSPQEVLQRAVDDGNFVQIKAQLLPLFHELAADMTEALGDSEGDFQANFLCEITSKVLHVSTPPVDDQRKILAAKFYDALAMETEAEQIFLREIVQNRENEVAWMNCGIYYTRRQYYDKAMVCIDEVLRINEISPMGKMMKAFLSFKSGKVIECKKWGEKFEENLKLDGLLSNSEEVVWQSMTHDDKLLSCHDKRIKFAVTLIKLGCYDMAEELIGDYYSEHGGNVNYFYLLAAIDAQKGNHGDALKHLRKIADNDIGNHQVNYAKISLTICINLMLNHETDKAMDLLTSFDDCDNSLLLFLLGRHYCESKMFAKAIKTLTKSMQIFPFELTFNELGKAHEKLNNLEMAEKFFQIAVNCDCRRASQDARKNLFDLYTKQKRVEAAKLCKI